MEKEKCNVNVKTEHDSTYAWSKTSPLLYSWTELVIKFAAPPTIFSEKDFSNSTVPRFVLPGWAHIVIGLFLAIMGAVDLGKLGSSQSWTH